ncbi:uncharacterized protein MELLADRAFT_59455 [Melampsora larici-populina 98AG31]|uniref:Clr5 domain-containing protein n=1 Tax=Melampsora larici-populina (strain 98AG31 / pathotype 3-4-7) TaxID=747676 RepID=F4R7J7_MELLP|nr:uncharacterized protein MELLADRAFT_59455 [Melampsora larici-populina 98AG31]EGG11774.1 hypothetical protein MELLADRAFT_59455 [Melampsora larici-populina 98AG31]
MPNPLILTEAYRPIVAALVQQGLTNRQIQDDLSTHHGITCSQSTITRARSNWELQIGPDNETQEIQNNLIRFYHGQGFVAEHLLSILEERHDINISPRTLARRCTLLGLQRRKDDVDQGLVTLADVAELIRHSKRRADGKRAGYRRVHHILRNQYQVSVHRLLFLYLWVPLVQDSLNKWMHDYNSYRKRRDKRTVLPTACAPNYCYYAPVSANGVEGLIPVPPERVDGLRAQYYPNAEQLMITSPEWLTEFVTAAQPALQIDPATINMDNVWTAFDQILGFMRAYDLSLLATPPGQPRVPTNHEQAVVSVQKRFGRVPL